MAGSAVEQVLHDGRRGQESAENTVELLGPGGEEPQGLGGLPGNLGVGRLEEVQEERDLIAPPVTPPTPSSDVRGTTPAQKAKAADV